MHFWLLVARRYGLFSRPVNTSLNWTIPAFTNKSVGSFAGTSDELLTISCPRWWKKSRKARRTSAVCLGGIFRKTPGFVDTLVREPIGFGVVLTPDVGQPHRLEATEHLRGLLEERP